jgi:hypothetical protein
MVEPDYKVRVFGGVRPDDTNLALQWHHPVIGSEAAWAMQTGSDVVKVGKGGAGGRAVGGCGRGGMQGRRRGVQGAPLLLGGHEGLAGAVPHSPARVELSAGGGPQGGSEAAGVGRLTSARHVARRPQVPLPYCWPPPCRCAMWTAACA